MTDRQDKGFEGLRRYNSTASSIAKSGNKEEMTYATSDDGSRGARNTKPMATKRAAEEIREGFRDWENDQLGHVERTYTSEHRALKSAILSTTPKVMTLLTCLDDLQQRFNDMQEAVGTLIDSKSAHRLRKLEKEVGDHVLVFGNYLHDLRTHSEDLHNHQKEMETSEQRFRNASWKLLNTLGKGEQATGDRVATDVTNHSESNVQPTDCILSPSPVELEAFCRAVAHHRHMGERYDDLLEEQQEQSARRQMQQDQEIELDQDEQAFEEMWYDLLENGRQDVEKAQAEAACARKVCDDAGITIPLWAEADQPIANIYPAHQAAFIYSAANFGERASPSVAAHEHLYPPSEPPKEAILSWIETLCVTPGHNPPSSLKDPIDDAANVQPGVCSVEDPRIERGTNC